MTGEWAGTMHLTEPQAGSDVGALTTRAVRQDDGTYRLSGTKIFITWGDHDMTDNIVHLVLARTPGAPPGTKGISLFLVPKFLVDADGSLGERNDIKCVSLEHKMGIHASPTCVMSYGDEGEGAVGYLIGEESGDAVHVHHDEQCPVGRGAKVLPSPNGPTSRRSLSARSAGRAGRPERPRARSSSSTPTYGGCCSPRKRRSRRCGRSSITRLR